MDLFGAFHWGHLHHAQHLVETIHSFSHQCFGKVLWALRLAAGICNGESNQPSIESHASSLIAMPRTSACSDSRWHVLLIYGSAYKFQRFQTIISGYAMLTIKNLHDHMQMQSTLLNWVAHEGLRSWCLLKFMFRATTFANIESYLHISEH